MEEKTINFFENYIFTVEFNFHDKDLTGILTIKQAGMLTLKIHTNDHNLLFGEHSSIETPIICQEIGSSKTFTLHCLELQRGGVIICEFVTTGGLITHDIDQIEICLTGVSTWFERLRANEITETEFKRYTHVDKFLVDFSHDGEDYSIENQRHISATPITPIEHQLKIQDSFLVKKKSGSFTLEMAENIALEIRNLFSLLLGHSLSIKQLYLIPSKSRHSYQSVIFSSVNYEEEPFSYYSDTLCRFDDVLGWNLWEPIVKNFFKIESFRTIWNRLVPSLSSLQYGFWEYDILSVVVTLEMYCTKVSKGKGHHLNKNNFNELKSELLKTLDNFINNQSSSSDEKCVLNGIKTAISGLKNTSHPTLQQKYDYLMSKTNPEIREAISFSDIDFTILKKIRNSAAHGENHRTEIPNDITKEIQIKDRLLTLLMYFVFNELGFNDRQIAQNFSRTHNPFIVNAGGNERTRDKLAGFSKFIILHEEVDLNDYKPHDYIALNYKSSLNQYTLNKDLSYEIKHNWHDSGIGDIRDFVRSLLQTDSNTDLNYVSKLYITSGTDEKCYYGAIVLTDK